MRFSVIVGVLWLLASTAAAQSSGVICKKEYLSKCGRGDVIRITTDTAKLVERFCDFSQQIVQLPGRNAVVCISIGAPREARKKGGR